MFFRIKYFFRMFLYVRLLRIIYYPLFKGYVNLKIYIQTLTTGYQLAIYPESKLTISENYTL